MYKRSTVSYYFFFLISSSKVSCQILPSQLSLLSFFCILLFFVPPFCGCNEERLYFFSSSSFCESSWKENLKVKEKSWIMMKSLVYSSATCVMLESYNCGWSYFSFRSIVMKVTFKCFGTSMGFAVTWNTFPRFPYELK